MRLRGKPSRLPSADEHRRLLTAFLEAARSGDVPAAPDGRSDVITFVDAVVATGVEAAWHSELDE